MPLLSKSVIAPALALSALATAQTAQAQQAQNPCINAEDLSDAVTYTLPLAFDAAMDRCDASYAPESFMRTDGPDFADRFRVKQDGAWPGAHRLLKNYILQRDDIEKSYADLISALPAEQVRPLFDAFVKQKIAQEIDAKACRRIERGLELIAPLPVENASGLVTFVVEMAGIKDPTVCRS